MYQMFHKFSRAHYQLRLRPVWRGPAPAGVLVLAHVPARGLRGRHTEGEPGAADDAQQRLRQVVRSPMHGRDGTLVL